MVRLGKMPVGGYEYLWWVEFGGVHLGEATVPGMFSAQGAGGHYILDVPSLDLVIVNQYDNEPSSHDAKTVLLAAQDKHAIFDDQFNHLVKSILDARVLVQTPGGRRSEPLRPALRPATQLTSNYAAKAACQISAIVAPRPPSFPI